MPKTSYDFQSVEEKWIRRWSEARLFEADAKPRVKKIFVAVPYPYMSGPLDLGAAYTILRADVYARFKHMQGCNVLFPFAWDWTGEPIVSMAERVRREDPITLHLLREVDKVPEEVIGKFHDPKRVAEYYTREGQLVLRRFGVAIDWRREFYTTSHNPYYSRFVSWQYTRLREKGYVTLGPHPVVWCPQDRNPVGDHDRIEGEGASPEEYTLIKFRMNDIHLPCTTLRPETIFGATNLWINPEAEYSRVRVDHTEEWVVSKEASFKLGEQLRDVEELGVLKGVELVGKSCVEAISKRSLLILPANFVDPKIGTGLVYSVPAHSPRDWLTLRELESNREVQERYGLKETQLMEIKPISWIYVEGSGELPAIETVESMQISGSTDPRVVRATEEISRKEILSGILKPNAGKYAKLHVAEAKERILRDLKKQGLADSLWDLPRPVICHCTNRCIVKILENQWSLSYSDPSWKAKVKEAASKVSIYPTEAEKSFEYALEWLHDHACTRRGGLGTPLPWDKTWIVETWSDSTIFMSYFLITKYVNEGKMRPEQLTLKFFDYIFNGVGSLVEVSMETGLNRDLLEKIAKGFQYWYPVDLYNSSKDLVPNHLPYVLFHHTALFKPEHWPKAFALNGFVTVGGNPMNKSKGVFVSLKEALEKCGADGVRVALMRTTQDFRDPDWQERTGGDALRSVRSFIEFLREVKVTSFADDKGSYMNKWLISRMQRHIMRVTEALEAVKTRTAFNEAFYGVWKDLKWYLRRMRSPNRSTLEEVVTVWLRLMAPFAPFACEELWEGIGESDYVSRAEWPEADGNLIDSRSEFEEQYRMKVLEDSMSILDRLKTAPVGAHYYTAPAWKWEILRTILEGGKEEMLDQRRLVRRLMVNPESRKHEEEIAGIAGALTEEVRELIQEWRDAIMRNQVDEAYILGEGREFFESELGVPISIHRENDVAFDPMQRSGKAIPLKPAIYMETKPNTSNA